MIDDDFDNASPLMSRIMSELDEVDAKNLERWVKMKPIITNSEPDSGPELMIGVTAVVCNELSKQFEENHAIQAALKTLTDEVIIKRATIFLPPDQPTPKQKHLPEPRSLIFLPPDEPTQGGALDICVACGQKIPKS